jgi:hypothetical protein
MSQSGRRKAMNGELVVSLDANRVGEDIIEEVSDIITGAGNVSVYGYTTISCILLHIEAKKEKYEEILKKLQRMKKSKGLKGMEVIALEEKELNLTQEVKTALRGADIIFECINDDLKKHIARVLNRLKDIAKCYIILYEDEIRIDCEWLKKRAGLPISIFDLELHSRKCNVCNKKVKFKELQDRMQPYVA